MQTIAETIKPNRSAPLIEAMTIAQIASIAYTSPMRIANTAIPRSTAMMSMALIVHRRP
jgi:hypothetical protein